MAASELSMTWIAIAVVVRGSEVLVGLRPPGVVLAGYAEFPGGKVQPGESLAEAAARECVEETGLAIHVRDVLYACEHDYPHGRVKLTFFSCEVAGDGHGPGLSEAPALRGSFRWHPLERLHELVFPAANQPVIERLSSG
jgi:mutator protein MutT